MGRLKKKHTITMPNSEIVDKYPVKIQVIAKDIPDIGFYATQSFIKKYLGHIS